VRNLNNKGFRRHILATPRVGGTAYGKLLAEQNNVKFFNEPYAYYDVESKKAGVIVGKSQIPELFESDTHVVHTQVSQYMDYFNLKEEPNPSEFIFLERRDKWAQMLSYCRTFTLYFTHFEFHNLNYTEEITVTVDNKWINNIAAEWAMYKLLKEKYINPTVLYYEDLVFPENFPLQKNKGLENIKIRNLDFLIRRFEHIWKYNPEPCVE
jgi:hypothetical protein